MLQNIIDGADCIVRATIGDSRSHEILRPSLQEFVGAAGVHGEKIDVFGVFIGQVTDWSEAWLSFFIANQQRYRAISKKHRLNDEGGIQPFLFELGFI